MPVNRQRGEVIACDMKRSCTITNARYRGRQSGVSIVELLVGVAIGLIIIAAASTVFVSLLVDSRSVVAGLRVNNNLRGALVLIERDLRRAGFWDNSMAGTTTTALASTPNPNSAVVASSGQVLYSISRDKAVNPARTDAAQVNGLDSDESFGFRISQDGQARGVLEMLIGANWNQISDPATINITALTITDNTQSVDISAACPNGCVSGSCPEVRVRNFDVAITGGSVRNPEIVRTLRTSVRIRNERTTGACSA